MKTAAEALAEYDAKWAGELGTSIHPDSEVDANCAPACKPEWHFC